MSEDTGMELPLSLCCMICEELGVDPDFVKKITITPKSGSVVVFKKDGDGKKYLQIYGDGRYVPATQTFKFKVTHGVAA